MNTIGIRCTPQIVYYSIVSSNGDEFSFINQELIIPKTFDVPNKLKYIRKTLLDIFREYSVEKAGIRITENNAQNPDKFRAMLEAVIQELIASSEVIAYFTGVTSSICSRLEIPNDGSLKEIIKGNESFSSIEGWSSISIEHRECLLVGVSSINL